MNPATLPTHLAPLILDLQLSFAYRADTTPVSATPDVTNLAERLFPDFPR